MNAVIGKMAKKLTHGSFSDKKKTNTPKKLLKIGPKLTASFSVTQPLYLSHQPITV